MNEIQVILYNLFLVYSGTIKEVICCEDSSLTHFTIYEWINSPLGWRNVSLPQMQNHCGFVSILAVTARVWTSKTVLRWPYLKIHSSISNQDNELFKFVCDRVNSGLQNKTCFNSTEHSLLPQSKRTFMRKYRCFTFSIRIR